ncbi:cytochrome P450 monooxygenase [Aspergillus bombycis]|uniref:Cytochrome P450 monooxygenase n=1 Tax=Aspergillus bombycis TaxID=109264 RepID=A0A1F8A1H3_9EURO|nr:cytochrome P450 monooxygenase [Aspergillus bombycis]OGM45572.1 cytochrome P450 monooxygenase [Aspergillus bombycis]
MALPTTNLAFLLSPMGIVEVIGGVIALVSIAAIASWSYNVFFHPLSSYPGPWLAAVNRLWYAWHCANGSLPFAIHELHVKYGDVVRVAPNELSYIHPDGWNEIYGHRPGKLEILKDPSFYSSTLSGPEGVFRAPRDRHGYLRRQMSHGFSEKSMREQEDTIRHYADLMISYLSTQANGQKENVVDFTRWYNYFTFDVMGQLVFGESFNCLQSSDFHPWVSIIFDSIRYNVYVRCAQFWPWLSPVIRRLIPKSFQRRKIEQQALSREKAKYRKTIHDGRNDLVANLLKPNSGVTDPEYQSTVQTLIVAGSETTASLLCGVTFHLLNNPAKLEKAVKEVRNEFDSAEKISFVSANKLHYLLACINEALRVYPPVADGFPRNTGYNVEVINGRPVPPNTAIRMTHWATYRSPRNFVRPNEYIPERWLGNTPGFENDHKNALQPFHVGPRNCIGRNLAYMEMRLLLALVLWNFDLELCPASKNWDNQRVYNLWEKPELKVKILPRKL